MTLDLGMWLAIHLNPYLGQVRRSRLEIKVHGSRSRDEGVPFSAVDVHCSLQAGRADRR